MRLGELKTKSEIHDTALKEQIIYIMLLRSGKHSFLPELLDVVGKDKMMELLQLFSGLQISFPTMSELNLHAKEVNIFFRMHRATKAQQSRVVKDLTEEYYIDEDTVHYIYKKLKYLLEDELLISV